jgi:hypothetical protein
VLPFPIFNKSSRLLTGEPLTCSGLPFGGNFGVIGWCGGAEPSWDADGQPSVFREAAAEGGKVERSQIVLNTPIKTLGVHDVLVRLHAEVSATVKINIARSADEAARQAKGEDVITAAYDEDRELALEQAKDMVAGGAGQQDGLGSEA